MKYDRGTAVLGEKPLNAPRATPHHPTPSSTRVSRSMQSLSRSFFRLSLSFNFFLPTSLSHTMAHSSHSRSIHLLSSIEKLCVRSLPAPLRHTFFAFYLDMDTMRIVVKLDREIPSFETLLSSFSCLLKYFSISVRIEVTRMAVIGISNYSEFKMNHVLYETYLLKLIRMFIYISIC